MSDEPRKTTYIEVREEDLADLVNLYCGVCQSGVVNNCIHQNCTIYKYLEMIKDD